MNYTHDVMVDFKDNIAPWKFCKNWLTQHLQGVVVITDNTVLLE